MNITSLLSRPSMRGIDARAGLERFAHNLCSHLGLRPVTVCWFGGPTAAINEAGDMLLADIGDAAMVDRQTIARYAGFITHELLHRKYTDFRARGHTTYVSSLHNALEDAWIERRAIREGLTGNIQGLLHSLIKGMVDEATEQVPDWANPRQWPFSLAIYCRQYGFTVPVPADILHIWQEAARRVDACQSSHDTLSLAVWVYEQLQQEAEQQEQQEQQQQGDDGQPDDGQDGQPDDGQDEQQGDGGQQQAGGDEQKAGQDGEPGQDDGQQPGQDGQQDGQQGGDDGQGDGQEGQQGGQGEPEDAGPITRFPRSQDNAMRVEPRLKPEGTAAGGAYTAEEDLKAGTPGLLDAPLWATDAPIPAKLRYQVRRLFENSAREWREGGFKSGTLHRPSLVKVPVGTAEVFARRMSQDGVDSAVAICLDISGSMFPEEIPLAIRHGAATFARMRPQQVANSNITVAVGACVAMLDTLAQAGAETMVLAFGQQSHVIKTWGQPWRKVVPTLGRLSYQGDTNDFAAVRFATEALMRHPAERKVLIAISDGQGNVDWTRAQVEAAKALGIRVIGIGIREDVRPTYGRESVRIDQVSDLGTVAFGQMKAAA